MTITVKRARLGPCQNKDWECERGAVKKWRGTPVCKRCYDRFLRTGDGRKHVPWQCYSEKRGK